ncbi:MAG: transglycosylase SLT domain-containing protein [Solirubrobacterales bacterium]
MKPLSICSTMALAICIIAPGRVAHAGDEDRVERLLDAIAQVESRRDPNAVGDHGRAVGIYQIHRRYWQDATRILGVDWPYADAVDPVKARQAVRAYLCHYGQDRSLLDMARIHNGGPSGDKKKCTEEYARKIEAILETKPQPS